MQGWVIIPVVAIVATMISQLARYKYGPMGGRGDKRPNKWGIRELEDRLAQVEQELQSVHQELIETQERVDFTERLLAKQKDAGKLGA
jgi:2-keto-3-deoxy-L-rhamnonate aldolase RhmA